MASTSQPKALSTSTLSLRFMQNAHRARNLAAVELEKAEVKDDGEWEIPKEIRDAWGPEMNATATVSYEASYVPFMFAAESRLEAEAGEDAPTAKAKGRRAFKRGREVADEPTQPTPESTPHTKQSGKIRQISSQSGGGGPAFKKEKSKGKSAREAVFASAGASVGTDLRPQRLKQKQKAESESEPDPNPESPPKQSAKPAKSTPSVFMKPAGVDAPPPISASARSKRAREEEGGEDGGHRDGDREGTTPSKPKKKKKKKRGETSAVATAE